MEKSIFQLVEQDAAEKTGVNYDNLITLWKNAGKPKEPQALVDFLKKHAKLDDAQVAEVFKSIGLNIRAAYGDAGVSLSPETVEKIQKYLAALSPEELKQLAGAVKSVKSMTGQEREAAEKGQQAVARS